MRIALVVACLAALGGCGDDGDESPVSGVPAGSVALKITVDDRAASSEAGLRCADGRGEADGYLEGADPAQLCSAALDLRRLLTEQPPADRACTQIFGGPQTAEVTGRLGSERVRRSFSRENGCRIAEWDRMAEAGLLPAP